MREASDTVAMTTYRSTCCGIVQVICLKVYMPLQGYRHAADTDRVLGPGIAPQRSTPWLLASCASRARLLGRHSLLQLLLRTSAAAAAALTAHAAWWGLGTTCNQHPAHPENQPKLGVTAPMHPKVTHTQATVHTPAECCYI